MPGWDAERYVQTSTHQEKLGEDLLSRLALRGDERILDIGCGDGRLAASIALRHAGCSVTGIDSSSAMVDFARHNHALPNLRFMIMSAEELHFHEEFDLIVSVSCLHWVADHARLLRSIRKALKDGGRTFLQFMGPDEHSPFYRALASTLRDPRWPGNQDASLPSFHFFSAADYSRLAAEAGLAVRRVQHVHKPIVYESREKFQTMTETIFQDATATAPPDVRQALVQHMVDALLEGCPPVDGAIHTSMPRLEVEVEKPPAGEEQCPKPADHGTR